MASILIRLTVFNLFTLVVTFVIGVISWLNYGKRNPSDLSYSLHLYLALFAIILNLGLHCLIFIYFLGTGRWVKEVALAYRLPDVPLPRLTRDLKRRTFPVALLAMLIPIATAAAGAAAYRKEWPWQVHLG